MKRIETIVETHEVWVIRRRRGRTTAFCAECPDQPEMLTAGEAASLCGHSLRAVFRLVEAGLIHFRELPGGELFVCPATLIQSQKAVTVTTDTTSSLKCSGGVLS